MIERYGYVPDSGGAGKFRGGLALIRQYRFLAEEGVLQLRTDRRAHVPYGLHGGRDGTPSMNLLWHDGEMREWFPPLVAVRGNERRFGWSAWAVQGDREWTVLRSLKRLLKRAGLTTAWASLLEGRVPDHFERPDVRGPDLVAVTEALIAMPPRNVRPSPGVPTA